jgi:hypothetical protein
VRDDMQQAVWKNQWNANSNLMLNKRRRAGVETAWQRWTVPLPDPHHHVWLIMWLKRMLSDSIGIALIGSEGSWEGRRQDCIIWLWIIKGTFRTTGLSLTDQDSQAEWFLPLCSFTSVTKAILSLPVNFETRIIF